MRDDLLEAIFTPRSEWLTNYRLQAALEREIERPLLMTLEKYLPDENVIIGTDEDGDTMTWNTAGINIGNNNPGIHLLTRYDYLPYIHENVTWFYRNTFYADNKNKELPPKTTITSIDDPVPEDNEHYCVYTERGDSVTEFGTFYDDEDIDPKDLFIPDINLSELRNPSITGQLAKDIPRISSPEGPRCASCNALLDIGHFPFCEYHNG